MLVIGRFFSQREANEPSRSIKSATYDGVDILNCDVYLTQDNIAVLVDDALLDTLRTMDASTQSYTLRQIKNIPNTNHPITLDAVLHAYFGNIMLALELKSRGSAKVVVELLSTYAKRSQSKWDNVLVSAHKPTELIAARRASSQVNLGFLQELNSFAFITYQPFLDLTAVGFHRLHINSLALQIAKKAGLFTYAYTVNRPDAARHLGELGIDGVVSERPSVIAAQLKRN